MWLFIAWITAEEGLQRRDKVYSSDLKCISGNGGNKKHEGKVCMPLSELDELVTVNGSFNRAKKEQNLKRISCL